MAIMRDDYEIDCLLKKAEEARADRPPNGIVEDLGYELGYADGVADTLAWLLNRAEREPDL